MTGKLTKKLQVLLSDEMVRLINLIILNDAVMNEDRPISVSAFIRQLIVNEIERRPNQTEWDPTNLSKLKDK